MKRFVLDRLKDNSGVSGTGIVVEGVKWSDGSVAVRWKGKDPSTTVWGSMEAMLRIHGHNGDTVIVWLDDPMYDHAHCNECHETLRVCLSHNTCPGCLASVS